MALPDESFGEELTEITEPNNGNFELRGLREAIGEFGFGIVRLCCVNCADAIADGGGMMMMIMAAAAALVK